MAVLVSFATQNFSQASALHTRSARKFGLGDIRIYDPGHAVIRDLTARHRGVMEQPRGAGYWLWKPFIIADVLKSVPEGTAVLYTDCAMTFIADPTPLLRLADDHAISLFGDVPGNRMSTWTKRDCFVGLDADSAEFWSLPQLIGGIQLYRSGREALSFLDRLKTAMTDVRHLTDQPNTFGLPNLPDFRDHRHDQSILTIMAHKAAIPVYPDPSQFGRWGTPAEIAAPYGQIFHLHRKRNASWFKHVRLRLRKSYTGGRYFL